MLQKVGGSIPGCSNLQVSLGKILNSEFLLMRFVRQWMYVKVRQKAFTHSKTKTVFRTMCVNEAYINCFQCSNRVEKHSTSSFTIYLLCLSDLWALWRQKWFKNAHSQQTDLIACPVCMLLHIGNRRHVLLFLFVALIVSEFPGGLGMRDRFSSSGLITVKQISKWPLKELWIACPEV